jgi:UDP-N-acetylmuramoylalanine--D-glutamate ligase
VLNADDETTRGYASLTRGEVRWFSGGHEVSPGAFLRGDEIVLDGRPLLRTGEMLLRGRHNAENAMAAALAVAAAGVAPERIAAALRTFRAVEHRLEFVRRVDGIDFYNDSKATSVDATLKALAAFEGGLWVILGGKDKGLDYGPLREPLAAKGRAALLIGAAAGKIGEALEGAVPLVNAGTLEAAIGWAFTHGRPGDTVVLAPACASFDQFRSFEHRGEVFKDLVRGLVSRSGDGKST